MKSCLNEELKADHFKVKQDAIQEEVSMLSNRIIECQINISVKVYKKRNIGIDSEADTNRNTRLFWK